jgi:hypothetical protein
MDIPSCDWSNPDLRQISVVRAAHLEQNMSTAFTTTDIKELQIQEENILHFYGRKRQQYESDSK